MKKYLLVIVFLQLITCAMAQRRGDLGVYSGYSYYLGEINPTTPFKSPAYAYGFLYRQSFNLRYAMRWSIMQGRLEGYDYLSPYAYNRLRNHSFNSKITDMTVQLEFNFLPYITTSPSYNVSTYVTSGLSYFLYDNSQVTSHIAIPFGVGIKVNVTKRISAGAELVYRKTFTDYLDGLGKPSNDPLNDPYLSPDNISKYRQNALPNRNDLYAFGGIFVTYKIFYSRTRCPAYDDKSFKE
ncbi:MAG: DUF6089 family protein [Bacteroidia bacterium]|nr:DUF6089 family protein [Bacteroidia bacterium]